MSRSPSVAAAAAIIALWSTAVPACTDLTQPESPSLRRVALAGTLSLSADPALGTAGEPVRWQSTFDPHSIDQSLAEAPKSLADAAAAFLGREPVRTSGGAADPLITREHQRIDETGRTHTVRISARGARTHRIVYAMDGERVFDVERHWRHDQGRWITERAVVRVYAEGKVRYQYEVNVTDLDMIRVGGLASALNRIPSGIGGIFTPTDLHAQITTTPKPCGREEIAYTLAALGVIAGCGGTGPIGCAIAIASMVAAAEAWTHCASNP